MVPGEHRAWGAYDVLLKVIVIGESGTGKSCLVHHFVENEFQSRATQTIGVAFASRILSVAGKQVKLQLWDTAGQERFRSVTRSYYRGAAVVVLVYDITQYVATLTRRSTFAQIQRWLDDARALASPHAIVVLVGNKLDREAEDREVSFLEASQWASEHRILFTETSSLNGENVQVPFVLGARAVLLAIESGRLNPERADSGIAYGEGAERQHVSESPFSFADSSLHDHRIRLAPFRLDGPRTMSRCCWQA
ncbi:uncharacterized protein MJAP1_004129 [Malassezia japonica]|uniref:Uncharacterized protein n=1 Tax=Malassezia japonica TaxID=223818 RepID=A0AAF0F718_9BASI|nr:uncharacterized protein MJAP1_004129 [Malassezia japonica]WFD41134.1 hypothetical protein MJAP1_004129 [Malassezia japonica]